MNPHRFTKTLTLKTSISVNFDFHGNGRFLTISPSRQFFMILRSAKLIKTVGMNAEVKNRVFDIFDLPGHTKTQTLNKPISVNFNFHGSDWSLIISPSRDLCMVLKGARLVETLGMFARVKDTNLMNFVVLSPVHTEFFV